MMMMGNLTSFNSDRTFRINSRPSIRGIRISVSTRSNLPVLTLSNASAPSAASVMFAWVMPSTRVSVIHRSWRIVAESSTTKRDLLVIFSSLRHPQQTHKTLYCSELAVCHRIKLRAYQCACCVSRKQLKQLVVQH